MRAFESFGAIGTATRRVVCVLFIVLAGYCRAGTNTVETIKASLDATNAGLDSALEKQKAEALASYGKALDTLQASLQQKGDLEGLIAVRLEKRRFDAEKTLDEANSQPAVVITTMEKYRTFVARLERERAMRGIVALKQAIAQCEALIKQQVMQGKIDEALATKQALETFRFVTADAESKLPPDTPPTPVPKPERKPTPAIAAPIPAPKPHDPEPTPAGPVTKKVIFGKHQYQLVLTKLSWHAAKKACEQAGGHLAIVNGEDENRYIATLLAGREAWIGCTDEAEEGTWLWVDGSKVSYAGWDPGPPEPNAAWDNEDYGRTKGEEGLWNDSQPDGCEAYVCEWDR
jgi:hypothetical protein